MPDKNSAQRVILASASPRRFELLAQIGIPVRACPVDIDETPVEGELPVELAMRLALGKARRCMDDMIRNGTELTVIGSDTVVDLDGEVLGKPGDKEQARSMLARLSGRKHKVHTAVAVVTGDAEFTDVSTSLVEMAVLTDAEIQAYVETGEPLDKAGAYAIQGLAARFIKSLQGSYSGVMGLPLYETSKLLAQCGVEVMRTISENKHE